MKIFIIEDDTKLREELSKLLISYGYECIDSDEFDNMIRVALSHNPDLILLDINLPFYDGYHICREIRKESEVPIIVVTSRNTDMDELMSMNLGADDFVTKPYNPSILLARISSVLKRSQGRNEVDIYEYHGVKLLLAKGKLIFGKQEMELTKNEMRILAQLIKHAGEIVTRDELMEDLWQSDEFVDDNTLTVNVNRLRHKLDQVGAIDFIKTKRGQGYQL